MNAPAVLELPLDDALLKVLSSESRREILRLLRERRMTGAELAARLDLGKPAVAEHLKKLQEAELIERFDDPERRWVYYSLSPRGRGILEPQRVRFYLVMAVAALGLMLGVALTLGLVVLLQNGPAGAGTLAATGAGDGSGILGGAGSPGVAAGTGLPVAATVTSTSTSAAPAPPPPPETVVGPTRPAHPVGNVTPAGPSAEAMALLIDPASVPKRRDVQADPTPMVLVYRASDVDPVNLTVQVHLVPLNATALAAANLTEAVQAADIVPDVGLVLVVPDTTPLPEVGNDTATLTLTAVPALPAANASVESGAAPPAAAQSTTTTSAPAPATTAPPPPAPTATQAPAAAGATAAAPTAAATTTSAPILATTTATTAPPAAGSGPSGSGQDSAGAQGGTLPQAPLQQRVAQQSPAASKAAPIPLLALLAAALMVSVYLPLRRNLQ